MVIRQQVLYGGEHSIDLHFVDGVTECNIMPLTEMCLWHAENYITASLHITETERKKLKTFATTFLKTSPLFLQEDQLCKAADAVLIPLTDHLNVILHPVCITADNCPLKSATIEVTMSY